jgi:hypothetical protein
MTISWRMPWPIPRQECDGSSKSITTEIRQRGKLCTRDTQRKYDAGLFFIRQVFVVGKGFGTSGFDADEALNWRRPLNRHLIDRCIS